MTLTYEIIQKWNNNRLINPITNRKIKENGPTYNKFLNFYSKNNNCRYDINKITFIQKNIRNWYLNKISGPAFKNPLDCNNDKDIISLDIIWKNKKNKKILELEFDKKLLFTYKINNLIFGLNIYSLEELFNKKIFIEPFTNTKFSKNLINLIYKKIKFIKKISIKKKEKITYNQLINNKIIKIIKILEKDDIYINVEWLKELKKINYIKLYKEIQYILNSYKNLYNDIYNKIIVKNLFIYDQNYLNSLNILQLKGLIFDIIYIILNKEKELNIQKMSCYIILAGLCYVSKTIKNAYPELQFY